MTSKGECVKLLQAWCSRNGKKLIGRPRHVYPRAYVIAKVAPSCLIIARPWMDCEPQLAAFNHEHPMGWIRVFDHTLSVGDWCITAYVSTAGCGESIAIPVPVPRAATKARDAKRAVATVGAQRHNSASLKKGHRTP